MSIAMAVLAITMVAMIMLYVGTQALNSMYTARKKSDRSVGMAAGDSAIEKYRVALQSGLADETNGYTLDMAAMQALVRGQGNITVKPNSQVPEMRLLSPVLSSVPRSAQLTVIERGTDTIGYWQVYHVQQPYYLQSSPAQDLVIYLRAWATGPNGGTITTKPRIFRVEYRPGYFSDYQVVTDAPFNIRDLGNVTVDGPIHSNGYRYLDWLALDSTNQPRTGIYFEGSPTCTSRARFSTSQNQGIVVPGGSCASARASARRDARQISLLGAEPVFRKIQDRCGVGNGVAQCVLQGRSSYDVQLSSGGVFVDGRPYTLRNTGPDSASLALVFDGDVILHGALSANGRAGRVTIATRRTNAGDRRPSVYLRNKGGEPTVGAGDGRSSVGVVTQGDVVMDGAPMFGCLRNVNLAAISTAGSVTIDPTKVTIAPPPVNLNGSDCGQVRLNGSFSGHGQQVLAMRWTDARRPGSFTPIVGYSRWTLSYSRNLFLTPPPFFPIATPWGVTKVKDADSRCLVGSGLGDPTCE